MYLTQSLKELTKYETIAQKALSALPPQISYRIVLVDEYNLSFRIYFDAIATNFWITDEGSFVYRNPEDCISQKVKQNDIVTALNEFLRDNSIES